VGDLQDFLLPFSFASPVSRVVVVVAAAVVERKRAETGESLGKFDPFPSSFFLRFYPGVCSSSASHYSLPPVSTFSS